jgi:putative redox protein
MTASRFSKHSIVATPEGGAKFAVEVREHRLITDQPARSGGTDTAPNPLELLGAALSACVALYVHRYCESEGLPADDVAVEVKPFWREDPGRIGRYEVVVHLPETIPEAHHETIEAVAQGCPVHNTLTHGPEISVGLRASAAVGV